MKMKLRKHPNLYEINTRVWLRRFSSSKKNKLKDVPHEYWLSLASKGFDAVWLMGIWKTNNELIEECCFEEGLTNSYRKALKDWRREDVIGSPFAIDSYTINPEISSEEELLDLKKHLNEIGIKLILDFIPNHFGAASELVKTHPHLFLTCTNECIKHDPHTFFRSRYNNEMIFAHGRDPFFPAWTDTIQLNYYHEKTREFMIEQLRKLPHLCDGIRCDMAMLILNNVFYNTWRGAIDDQKFTPPETEFWKDAIESVKRIDNDFLFIAEAYWDLGWQLQQLGFDFTYDKRFYERLLNESPASINAHLNAEDDYQNRSVRFIENHDEERALTVFGKEKINAAVILLSTVKGIKLFHDGQFEGRRIKLPVQLGREPQESSAKKLSDFYSKILAISNHEIFHEGEWTLLEALPSWEGNEANSNFLCYMWRLNSESRLVAVNYSSHISQCRIKLPIPFADENIIFTDLLTGKKYVRQSEEIFHSGLYVELPPYHSHIFSF